MRRSSLDLPGGSVKTEGGEILLRTKGARTLEAFFFGVAVAICRRSPSHAGGKESNFPLDCQSLKFVGGQRKGARFFRFEVFVERLLERGGKGLELVPNLFQDFGGFRFGDVGAELDLPVELDVFEDGAIVVIGHDAQ